MRQFQVVLSVLAFLATLAPLARSAEHKSMTWNVDGIVRQALVFAPTTATEHGGAPLVFAFHGHGGTMKNSSLTMRFQTAWPEAIVVYMQGLKTPTRIDPEGKRPGWQHVAGE